MYSSQVKTSKAAAVLKRKSALAPKRAEEAEGKATMKVEKKEEAEEKATSKVSKVMTDIKASMFDDFD